MARGAGLAESLLWDRPALAPGAWDLSVGLYAAPDALGAAGQLTRQMTKRLAAFARAQAGVAKLGGQWQAEASGAAGIRVTW